MLVGGLALFGGIYVGYFMQGSLLNFFILFVLVADVVFRYDAVLGDKAIQPGFLEWLFRRCASLREENIAPENLTTRPGTKAMASGATDKKRRYLPRDYSPGA